MTLSFQPESTDTHIGEAPGADPVRTAQPAVGAVEGAIPPQVIRGESKWIGEDEDTGERAFLVPNGDGGFKLIPIPSLETHPYAAITDWLNFSFPLSSLNLSLGDVFTLAKDALGPEFLPAVERRGGKYKYDYSFDLGFTKSIFAYGGNRGTALFSLTGEACALIRDWHKVVEFGRDKLKGRITRWDGAVDDYVGLHSVDYALELYLSGKFGTGGRLPQMKQHGNWALPDGRGRGIEIGARENGKRLQVYEKGMQLGEPWHPWVRWEATIGNKGRVVPWDVLLEPGRYVVGAYPKPLGWVQKEMSRIATLQKQATISYSAMKYSARQAYGKLFSVMLEVEGSPEKVVDLLVRPGVPARLNHPARPKIDASHD
jgi:phage replication initiation protein